MEKYNNILLAVDMIDEDDNPVVKKATEIAERHHANLYIVHSVEHPNNYGFPYETTAVYTWQEELEEHAKEKMNKFGAKLDIPKERRFLEIGSAKNAILSAADKANADLIVMGSHGRHGLDLLILGSTTNAILHHAKCDVLAVRIK